MSSPSTNPVINVTRQQYLEGVKAQVITLAKDAKRTGDEVGATHYTLYFWADDLRECHRNAARAWSERGKEHRAAEHEQFAAMAHQIALHHLSQLAHLYL